MTVPYRVREGSLLRCWGLILLALISLLAQGHNEIISETSNPQTMIQKLPIPFYLAFSTCPFYPCNSSFRCISSPHSTAKAPGQLCHRAVKATRGVQRQVYAGTEPFFLLTQPIFTSHRITATGFPGTKAPKGLLVVCFPRWQARKSAILLSFKSLAKR